MNEQTDFLLKLLEFSRQISKILVARWCQSFLVRVARLRLNIRSRAAAGRS